MRWTGPRIDFILLGTLGGGVFLAIGPEGGDFKEHSEESKDTAMILVSANSQQLRKFRPHTKLGR